MKAYVLAALVGSLLATLACGAPPEVPRVVYEQRLNPEKFTDCMIELLTINETCRTQEDDRVFSACVSEHHRYCVEQSTEMVRGGVE